MLRCEPVTLTVGMRERVTSSLGEDCCLVTELCLVQYHIQLGTGFLSVILCPVKFSFNLFQPIIPMGSMLYVEWGRGMTIGHQRQMET